MQKIAIAKSRELREGQTIKFQFVCDGKKRDGFVARFDGEIVAYENSCRHIAINLDDEHNRIFSRDGEHFLCQTHGAIYDPLSALCVRGPYAGESLIKLQVEVAKGVIWLVETVRSND